MELALQCITAVAALIGAVAVGFVAQQLWFGAWTKAQEIFVDEKFTTARVEVYARIPGPAEVESTWTKNDYVVCRKMDELARLAPYLGIFGSGDRLVLRTWLDPLAKSWIVLHSLVQEERNKTPGWTKWDAFEKLGKRAMNQLGLKEIPKHQLVSPKTENKQTNKPDLRLKNGNQQ